MARLVFGVGINDAEGARKTVYYCRWVNMLARCYSNKTHTIRPTYKGCFVCNEWLTFSRFKSWMETQDWEGKHLDKDILYPGNKIYSPDTCVFVDAYVNLFTTDNAANRGDWPTGVMLDNVRGKFKVNCSNPITGRQEFLGRFTCPNEAHQAWRKRKHELACQLADLQSDQRVANALRNRYL